MKELIRGVASAPITGGISVIVRADCDVAARGNRIADDFRLRALLPTLRFLMDRGVRLRILAHRGRPGGIREPSMSLAPIERWLARELDTRVVLVRDPFAVGVLRKYGGSNDILLFENLRFWRGEEKNDPAFAQALAKWGDIYVNEAFADCHRTHASMVGLPHLLPAYAGLHLVKEIAALERVMRDPARPLVAVFGGAKIETKMPLLRRFLRDADSVLVGGALANTLLAAQGRDIGKSSANSDVSVADLLRAGKKLVLPLDVLTASALKKGSPSRVCAVDDIRADEYIADIGPASRILFSQRVSEAKTVVWNGPMGYAEVPAFGRGTAAIADAMKKNRGFTVVGGGDTLAAIARIGQDGAGGFDHVSTGGGAMLAFLSGEKLPGIEALKKSYAKSQE